MMHNLTIGTNQKHTVCTMIHNLTKLSISFSLKCWFRSQNTHQYLFVTRQRMKMNLLLLYCLKQIQPELKCTIEKPLLLSYL
ncbi:hypothetical protein Hanom_Chr06g00569771 [Helianthus anomalus]